MMSLTLNLCLDRRTRNGYLDFAKDNLTPSGQGSKLFFLCRSYIENDCLCCYLVGLGSSGL